MRAAVYYNNKDIRLEDVPRPEIGPGELLVKVSASGICGTDLMEWYRIKKAPRILGHEITGTIAESKSSRYTVGQRVFVSHHVPCNQCQYCLEDNHSACDTLHAGNYDPGGYSEFVRVPAINVERGVYVLPENVSDEEGTWIEPLACAVRGQRVIGIKENQMVLIFGCGIAGLSNIQLAKLKKARVIAVDTDEFRLQKAREFGADQVINAREAAAVKAQRIIICTAALNAVKQALRCIDKKGVILLFAIPQEDIPVPTADFWRNEITLTASYGAAPRDLEESLGLIKNKKIDVKAMISHRLPLEKIQEGFNLAAMGGEVLKVVLIP